MIILHNGEVVGTASSLEDFLAGTGIDNAAGYAAVMTDDEKKAHMRGKMGDMLSHLGYTADTTAAELVGLLGLADIIRQHIPAASEQVDTLEGETGLDVFRQAIEAETVRFPFQVKDSWQYQCIEAANMVSGVYQDS